MAHPADTGSKAQGAFAAGRLSPEDADRLAAMFRPSWELDDAPFTGPGSLEPSEVRALQGGGVHADVRAAAQNAAYASNGAHAVPAPQASHEPENSVVIDRSITAEDIAQAPPAKPVAVKPIGTGTMLGMAAPPAPQAAPQPVPAVPQAPPPPPVSAKPPPPTSVKPPPPSQRPKAPQFTVGPPTAARPKAVSVDLDVGYPKKSRTPLYAGLGGVAVLVIGGIIWAASSSGSGEKAATPVPTATQTVEDKAAAIPPPPPATQAATAATTVTAPPPATTTVAAAPPPAPAPIPQAPVTALPAAAPLPTHAAAAPRSYGGGAPAGRPAGKGKATIVRDVPF